MSVGNLRMKGAAPNDFEEGRTQYRTSSISGFRVVSTVGDTTENPRWTTKGVESTWASQVDGFLGSPFRGTALFRVA